MRPLSPSCFFGVFPLVLKRSLGWGGLLFYGVGDILGAGIYALVGKVAAFTGYAAWMSFLAAFVVAGLTALSYAELSSRIPRSAGAAAFTLEAFRKPVLSFVVGLLVLLSGVVSMAAASHAFTGYLLNLKPLLPGPAVILIFFLVLAAINFKGIHESSKANILCTSIELAGLLIVIFAGLKFLGRVDYLEVRAPEGMAPAAAVLQGSVLAFYAFLGFEDLVNVSEETKNPAKVMPRVILVSLAVSSAIYILVALCVVSVLSPESLAASKAPLVDAVRVSFPAFPIGIFSFIALFAVANTALLNFIMGSRVLYGMANDRLLPPVFSKTHPVTGTPYASILAILGIVLVIAYSGTLAGLARATSVLLCIVFILVHASLIALKRRAPHTEGIFRVPAVVPVAGILSTAALIASTFL